MPITARMQNSGLASEARLIDPSQPRPGGRAWWMVDCRYHAHALH